MKHDLKILPKYFDAVKSNIKPFEVRKKDRDFNVGDMLYLREYDPECNGGRGECTGRYTIKYITYILDDSDVCADGYVVLGLRE